jgi:phage terminase small subunit
MRTSTAKRLTHKERELVRNLIGGMSVTRSALAAGYSEKNPGQSGWQALQNIRRKMPEVFAQNGLTDAVLIEKHLIPALEAQNTLLARKEGQIIYQRSVIAWDARLKALDIALRLRGLYLSPKRGS